MTQLVQMPDGAVVEMPDNPTPAQVNALQRIQSGASQGLGEAARVLDTTVRGGITALPRFAWQVGQWLESKFPSPSWAAVDVPKPVADAASYLFEPNRPQTEVGQLIGNVGEAAVGSLIGPGALTQVGRNLMIGAAGGLGGEAAAASLGDNPLTRIAGALVGGGLGSAAAKYTPTSVSMIRDATAQVPRSDWQTARATKQVLDEAGIPSLASQHLGSRSTLDDVVSLAAQHSKVRPRVLSAVEAAPERARQALEVWKLRNLPPSIDETRSVLTDIQKTASDAIRASEKADQQVWRSTYNAVAAQTGKKTVPYLTLQRVERHLQDLAGKFPNTGKARLLRKLAARLRLGGRFINNGEQLNEVLKGYYNSLSSAPPSANPIARGDAKYVQGVIGDIRNMLGTSFAPIREANAAWLKSKKSGTEPMQRGLAGQIAQMGGGVKPDRFTARASAIDMVFPRDIKQPGAITKLAEDIGGEAVGELLREHLSRTMERTVKMAMESPRAKQPFDFVQQIAGTNAQRQNLEAALEATAKSVGANPKEVRNGFYKLMRAFSTTKDLKIPAAIDKASTGFQAGFSPVGLEVAPQSGLRRFLWERATERTYRRIADIVLSPDGIEQLQKIAQSPSPTVAGPLARTILTTSMQYDVE